MKSFDPREELYELNMECDYWADRLKPMKRAKYHKIKEKIQKDKELCRNIKGSWFALYDKSILEEVVPYIIDTKRTAKWLNRDNIECFVNEDMQTFLIYDNEKKYEYIALLCNRNWTVLFPDGLSSLYLSAKFSIAGRELGIALREAVELSVKRAIEAEREKIAKEVVRDDRKSELKFELAIEEQTVKKKIPMLTKESMEFLERLSNSMLPDIMSNGVQDAYVEYVASKDDE